MPIVLQPLRHLTVSLPRCLDTLQIYYITSSSPRRLNTPQPSNSTTSATFTPPILHSSPVSWYPLLRTHLLRRPHTRLATPLV